MEQQPQVEILVHIGAPSRAVDDTWYRSLATSYVDFQPENRVNSFGRAHPGTSNDAGGSSFEGRGIEQVAVQDVSRSSPSSEPFSSFKSPQASFRSVIDNAGSPRLPERRTPEPELAKIAEETSEQATQSSWQTPSSVVQDSYLENAVDASILTSPTRVLESYLQHFGSPIAPSATSQEPGNGISSSNSQNPTCPSTTKNKLAAPLVPATPQIVPCTPRYNPSSTAYGNLKIMPEGKQQDGHLRNQPHIPQQDEVSSDNIIEETIIMESSDPSSVTRADSEPPPAKRHQPDAEGVSPRALLRAASDIGPRSASNQRSPLTVTFLSDHGYTYESIEIRAPEPPVGIGDLDAQSLITPGLERLARDLDISKRYKPHEETRDLRAFERGFWYLDCSTMEPQLKRDTWAYLANYVGTGVAGWGVWCKRDEGFQWLRVYCWGSIVAHIYLLLYLATQRKVRSTGCSWRDGDGIPVVVMEARG
ncbi:Rho-type GTPase activating protein Rga1 [Hypoxylon texense]